MEKVLRDYKKDKNKLYNIKFKIGRNRLNRYSIEDKNANRATFGKKIEEIITSISEDIDECNEKQEKEIKRLCKLRDCAKAMEKAAGCKMGEKK